MRAGQFRICYRVAAGLDGKAKAAPAPRVAACRSSRSGQGNVSNVAPRTGVADDGETITTLPDETEPLVAGLGRRSPGRASS